jgi:hypothetical protein
MARSSYTVCEVVTGNILFEASSFPSCQTFSRNFLTNPINFGKRLQVFKNRNISAGEFGEKVFDVTSIRYSSGKVRMTLYSEFLKHQKKSK